MHALYLQTIKLVFPFLFFFRPSGLDDVSRPIQELALSPYVVNEVQQGIVYGITSYASVPQITTILLALFPAGGSGPAAAEDMVVPEAQPGHQHPYNKLPHVTPSIQGTPLAIFQPSASVDVLETVTKPPVQQTRSISSQVTPDIANISKTFQDLSTDDDPVHYSSSSVIAGTAVFITSFVLLLLCRTALLLVFDVCSAKVPPPSVIYLFKLFLCVASCGILGNYIDANPQVVLVVLVAGYMLRKTSILRIIYGISGMVRAPSLLPFPPHASKQYHKVPLSMCMALPQVPMLFDSGRQTNTNTQGEPEANTRVGIAIVSFFCPPH